MVVGVCRLSFVLPTGHSLKAKRSVLNRIKERVRNKFNVTIAEVGSHDLWQRIDLGLAVAGNDGAHVDSQLSNVQNFIASLGLAELVDSWTEVLHFNDGFREGGDDGIAEEDDSGEDPGDAFGEE